MAAIIIVALPLLKYIIWLACFNFLVHISAHIYNKTFDYRKSLDFLIKLSGYVIAVLVFSILACAASDMDMNPSYFYNALNVVSFMIMIKYARDILDGLIIWGVDVAKFIPFVKNAQDILRQEYHVNSVNSVSKTNINECDLNKKNIW